MKMSTARFASTLAKSLQTHDLVLSCGVLLLAYLFTPKRTGFLASSGHQISSFFLFGWRKNYFEPFLGKNPSEKQAIITIQKPEHSGLRKS